VEFARVIVIAGQEVACPANGSDSGRSPEINVNEPARFGRTDVLRRWRGKPSTFLHNAGLTLEVGNVLRGDCIQTIDSTSPVQSQNSPSTQVAQTVVPVSKYWESVSNCRQQGSSQTRLEGVESALKVCSADGRLGIVQGCRVARETPNEWGQSLRD
jgi:hypothetical protein